MKIVVTRGLDLSLQGSPKESGLFRRIDPTIVAVDLRPYSPIQLKILVSPGDNVAAGDPVAAYKYHPDVFITSPVDGEVTEIRRGEKRILLDVMIKKKPGSSDTKYAYDLASLSKEELFAVFKKEGLFALFKQRPFDIPALPTVKPRDVFINLAENKPFSPSIEKLLHVFSSREEGMYVLTTGIKAVSKLFGLRPHVISTDQLVLPAKDLRAIAELHTISGPFPSGLPSVHIKNIAPIKSEKDHVFTISFQEVLSIGHLFLKGKILSDRVVALAGSGLPLPFRKYIITSQGACLADLLPITELENDTFSLISGDPLTGRLCAPNSTPCLGLRDFAVTVLRKPRKRTALNFLRLGWNKFTLTRAYLSGFFQKKRLFADVDTNLHGETRPFIDSEVYDSVMALDIPLVPLMKAVITKNFELACKLGFLEISSEDFALPTFIDPSKIEMMSIMHDALIHYAKEIGLFSSVN